jgi:tripartite-type tricarboxylate transporter receptor subunit TctC
MNLIGRPSLPANNMTELVSWINANKGKINIANAGPGSASHLCGMLFQSTLKVDMTSVPYKGTAPAMTDLIGGQVDLMCDQTTTTIPQIEGKKVKSFAVTHPPDCSGPQRFTHHARGRTQRLFGHHLARLVCTQRHACAGLEETQ